MSINFQATPKVRCISPFAVTRVLRTLEEAIRFDYLFEAGPALDSQRGQGPPERRERQ
jgi:hypothetical protein